MMVNSKIVMIAKRSTGISWINRDDWTNKIN